MRSLRNVLAIFKRELKSYFESPVAYVFLVVFLVLQGALTFLWPWGPFYERGMADLQPFFFWLPLLFLILVPAATMGLWASERESGTIELLLTMPVKLSEALVGKFMAAWLFMSVAVLLTFPIVLTTMYLGEPDLGVVLCGYVGAILLAGACVAIGMLTSSMTRNQVIAFILSFVFCFVLVLAGTPFITNVFVQWVPAWLLDIIGSLSLWTHFQSIQRGVIDLRDVVYYASVIVFMFFATHVVLENRKSA